MQVSTTLGVIGERHRPTSRRADAYRTALVVGTLWLSYAGLYLGRVNVSAVIPLIGSDHKWTTAQTGVIVASFFWAYAVGLLINGQFAESINVRWGVPFALCISACMNLMLPRVSTMTLTSLIWAGNGYVQSFGWPLVVKTVALWVPIEFRGRAAAVASTSYVAGGAVSLAFAGYVAARDGWQAAFTKPAGLMILIGIFGLLFLRQSPVDGRSDSVTTPVLAPNTGPAATLVSIFWQTVRTPRLCLLALSLSFVNTVRYGFIVWAPSFLFQVKHLSISRAAYTSVVFPLAGCIGILIFGWLSDLLFAGRRAPLASMCMAVAAILILTYQTATGRSGVAGMVILGAIGVAAFSAHMLIVSASPMDLAVRGARASATGFIDSVGYVGVAANTVITGILVHVAGWAVVFYFWSGAAFLASVCMIPLWRSSMDHQH